MPRTMGYPEPQNLWGKPLDLSGALAPNALPQGVPAIDPAWVGSEETHGTAWKVLCYLPVPADHPDSFDGEYTVHVQLGSENGYLCDYGWSTKTQSWHCWAN